MSLKNLIFKDDDKPIEESKPEVEEAKEESIETSSSEKVSETDVKKMTDHLSKVLAEKSEGDMNYLKFRNAVRELAKGGTSEESAMKSAFTTFKTMGFTKQKLVSSISSASSALAEEKRTFIEELKARKQTELNEVDTKIKELESQLNSMSKEKEKLEKSYESSKVKIHNVEYAFNEAVTAISEKIKSDTTKINTILGE
jgi:hypothetical protein